jgi:hypothetical protein
VRWRISSSYLFGGGAHYAGLRTSSAPRRRSRPRPVDRVRTPLLSRLWRIESRLRVADFNAFGTLRGPADSILACHGALRDRQHVADSSPVRRRRLPLDSVGATSMIVGRVTRSIPVARPENCVLRSPRRLTVVTLSMLPVDVLPKRRQTAQLRGTVRCLAFSEGVL